MALSASHSLVHRENTPSSRGAWFLPFHKKSRQRKKKKEMEGPHRKKKRIHPKKNGARAPTNKLLRYVFRTLRPRGMPPKFILLYVMCVEN